MAGVNGERGASEPRAVVIVGAGPAGLTAAFELVKAGHASAIRMRHKVCQKLAPWMRAQSSRSAESCAKEADIIRTDTGVPSAI